ncbi:hypothetical protein GQ54DRAFT_301191 [Martensiomyces pterosporus]|nr:hypothetical protein GQ54DRAFT_301191 [Martensiomyces pterosporus]
MSVAKSSAGEPAVVPASRRADGSMRKERRIRPGYTPQESMPKYMPPSMRRRQQGLEAIGNSAEGDEEKTPRTNTAANTASGSKTEKWPSLSTHETVTRKTGDRRYTPPLSLAKDNQAWSNVARSKGSGSNSGNQQQANKKPMASTGVSWRARPSKPAAVAETEANTKPSFESTTAAADQLADSLGKLTLKTTSK